MERIVLLCKHPKRQKQEYMYYITKKYITQSITNDTSYLVNCLDGVSLEKVFTFWHIGLFSSKPALETVYLSVNNKCNQSCFLSHYFCN